MSLRYLGIVIFVVSLAIFYTWQNITMVNIRMHYRELYGREKEMIQENDLLRYKIEKLRTITHIRKVVKDTDVETIRPSHVTVIVERKKGEDTRR